MDNKNLLSSLSQHIAYWYTTVKGEKDIIFPINNVIKEKANQIFRDRYYEADVIISENGDIYKISKEICCESNKWSYMFYLDDMKKNYRLKNICKNLLPYDLNADDEEKIKIIKKLNIPVKILNFNVDEKCINHLKEIISPYLKSFTYINSKKRQIISYPDILMVKKGKVQVLLNYYHHHHMKKHIKKMVTALDKYKINDIEVTS